MIKSLHLKGLQSHTDSTVEFAPGVNVILGETNAGKTAVIRALQWIFQNRPLGTGLTQKDAKECLAEVTTDRGTASRIRRRGFNGYVVNEVEYKEIGSSVPDELTPVLDLRDVSLQEQLQPHFLITQPAGYISRYVGELLGLNSTDQVASSIKSGLTAIRSESTRLAESLEAMEVEKASYESLDEVDGLLRRAETLDQEHASVVASCTRLASLIEAETTASVALKSLSSKVKPLDDAISGLSSTLEEVAAREADLRRFVDVSTSLSRTISQLKAAESYVQTNRPRVAELENVITSLDDSVGKLSQYASLLTSIKQHVDLIESMQTQLGTLSTKAASKDREIEETKNAYVELLRESGSCPVCLNELRADLFENLVREL